MDPLEFVGYEPSDPKHREAFRSLQRFAAQVEPDLVSQWRGDFRMWVTMYEVVKSKAADTGYLTWGLIDITPVPEADNPANPYRMALAQAIAAGLERHGLPPGMDSAILGGRIAGFLELVPDIDFDGGREVWVGTCHLCARAKAWHGNTFTGKWQCHHCGVRGVVLQAHGAEGLA